MDTKKGTELKVNLLKYELQVKIRNGSPVTICSSDFRKKTCPYIDSFKEFPFLRNQFHDYVKEKKSRGTADSYVNYYLPQLVNQLPFTNVNAQDGRKWFLLLPYIFAYDIDSGFQLFFFFLNQLNNHISKLKKDNLPFKTFQNRKCALQAYINFLSEIRDNDIDSLSCVHQVNKTIINAIKRHFSGITIPIDGPQGLIRIFLSRMRSEDRYPAGHGAVYYPAKLLSKVLGTAFTNVAVQHIKNLIVFTDKQSYKLSEIGEITIDKNGNTYAVIKNTKEVCNVLNYEKDLKNPLIANSEADLSREHAPSIATILQNPSMYPLPTLCQLTKYIKNINPSPKQEDASDISKAVQQQFGTALQGMKQGLLDDLNTILSNTKFTLMQRSLNSSLNKHL